MAEQKQQNAQSYLVEMEDGTLVNVPADKLDSWSRAQKEGPRPLNEAERRLKDRIVQEIFGSKK